MRVNDPQALPLSDSLTADPSDRVIGLDFTGGIASVVNQLNTVFGPSGMQFSNPAGTTLRALDDGAGNRVNVDALSAVVTATSFTGGGPELPFFMDASTPYTGAVTSQGMQSIGFAGRIVLNAALMDDPSRLVVFQTAPMTQAGDPTRPNFIVERLMNATLDYSPRSGIGTSNAPFKGSLPAFMRQIVSHQGEAAEAANSLKAGQDVVFNSLRERFSDSSSVNIDQEMANLLNLQNAYAANARVMSTVKEMLESLMRI